MILKITEFLRELLLMKLNNPIIKRNDFQNIIPAYMSGVHGLENTIYAGWPGNSHISRNIWQRD